MAEQIQHLHVTYNDIHKLIRKNTPKIKEFNPDLLIAIGLFLLSTVIKPVLIRVVCSGGGLVIITSSRLYK
jgi:hypothetical protein